MRITATIAVPTSKTADEVKTSLSSSLGTTAAASTALGITVEEMPTITVKSSRSDSSNDLDVPAIVGIAVACALGVGLVLVCACVMLRRRNVRQRSEWWHTQLGGPATRKAEPDTDLPNAA